MPRLELIPDNIFYHRRHSPSFKALPCLHQNVLLPFVSVVPFFKTATILFYSLLYLGESLKAIQYLIIA